MNIEKEKEFNKIFSENLNHYMLTSGTTRSELAKLLHVSVTSVANWCNGLKTPRMDKVDKMCHHFGINRSDLMEDKSKQTQDKNISIFTDSEHDLIHNYRQLNEEGQEKAVEYVSDLAGNYKYKKRALSEMVDEV